MTTLLVAFDSNRVMGKGSTLPWHIPEDLKLFKKRTFGHSVIMGRKTWDSIPKKPLRGRYNIILSRGYVDIPIASQGDSSISITNDIHDAIQLAQQNRINKEIFIIGGSQIYELALQEKVVDFIIVSKINGDYDGDIYFPELGKEWYFHAFEKHNGFDSMYYKKVDG